MSITSFKATSGTTRISAKSNKPLPDLSFDITTNDGTTISFGLDNNIPAEKPIKLPDVPNEPVNLPSEPVNIPSESVNVPSEPVNIPSEPVSVPSEPVNVPSEPVSVPSEPVNVPSESVNVPVESINVPVEPANVPSEPANVPSEPVNVPSESANIPTKPDDSLVEETDAKFVVGDPIIAIYDNNEIVVRSLETNKEIRKITNLNDIFAIGISPDNQSIIYCQNSGSFAIYNLNDRCISAIYVSSSSAKPTSFTVSPKNHISIMAIGYNNGCIGLICGSSARTAIAGNTPITHLSFSPDGKYLFAESDCVYVLDTHSNLALVNKINYQGIHRVMLSNSKKIYGLDRHNSVIRCDSENFEIHASEQIGGTIKRGFAISSDENFIAICDEYGVIIRRKNLFGNYCIHGNYCDSNIIDVFCAPNQELIVVKFDVVQSRPYDNFTVSKKICDMSPGSLIAVSKN